MGQRGQTGFESTSAKLTSALDGLYLLLSDASTAREGMRALLAELSNARATVGERDWQRLVERIQAHPITKTCHEDPFTRRAFDKPRGYPGDAVLMDYLYREPGGHLVAPNSERGAVIMDFKLDCPSGDAVRWRRHHLAAEIDQVSDRVDQADVLSVACGHFREGQLSRAVREHRVRRIVALDQDQESIDLVRHEQPQVQVRPMAIQSLLRGTENLDRFDLIYAAGLYDYLKDSTARRLTRQLARMLTPGGKLLVANFVPNTIEAGYMDSVMAWPLIYRGPARFADLVHVDGLRQHTYMDPSGCVVYAELRRDLD